MSQRTDPGGVPPEPPSVTVFDVKLRVFKNLMLPLVSMCTQ
jgi:hypothetical protein